MNTEHSGCLIGGMRVADYCVLCREYGDGGGDDEPDRNKPKVTIRETLGEGNIQDKLTNITGNVAGKLGNVMGKGIGGLSKFGGGSWF